MATEAVNPVVLTSTSAMVVVPDAPAEDQVHETTSLISSFEIVDPPKMSTSFASVPLDPQSALQSQELNGQLGLSTTSSIGSVDNLSDAVKELRVTGDTSVSSSKGSELAVPNGLSRSETLPSEDPSQKFPSHPSTKAPSLDGKSVTSGTTFALDEKESLRPDDSASAKAAEEEDSYSGSGTGAAGSRVGSEAGARAFGDQFYEISTRMGEPSQRDGINTRFAGPMQAEPGAPNIGPSFEKERNQQQFINPAGGFPGAAVPFGFARLDPDEKLLEALETPKDRLFLLRLEQEVIEFVKDPAHQPTLDLPPSNSFYRLLTHKLADYYFLTHFVDVAVGAVRLFRTPYCRLPPPLTNISNPAASTGSTPPPNTPAVKIMRRAAKDKETRRQVVDAESDQAGRSMCASKATSEAGGDSCSDGDRDGVISRADSTKGKASMTREQKEAKYKEARERIFKGFKETSEATEDNAGPADGKELSRASSANGQDKGASGSKSGSKQRVTNDDGFEARSQFNVYYPPQAQFPTAPYTAPTTYGQFTTPSVNPAVQVGGVPFVGGQQQYNLNLPPMVPQNGMPQPQVQQHQQHQQQMPHHPQQPQQPYFPTVATPRGQGFDQMSQIGYTQPGQMGRGQVPLQQPNIMPQQMQMMTTNPPNNYGPALRPQPILNTQQWLPNPQHSYPTQFHGHGFTQPQPQQQPQPQPMDRRNFSSPGHMPSQTPYPFGQLPSKPFVPATPFLRQNQHPVPGSYTRQPFNPQTQAFVPSGGFPMNQAASSGPQAYPSTQNLPFSGNPMTSAYPRHGTSSIPQTYSSPQTFQTPQIFPSPQMPSNSFAPNHMQPKYPPMGSLGPPPIPAPNFTHSPRQTQQGSIHKWAAPSSLPPKPPPPSNQT